MPYKNPDDLRRVEANQRYYKKNKEAQLQRKRDHRKRIKDIINKCKSVPCKDCRITYIPCVMDFDHVEGEKEFQIAEATHMGVSIKRLLEEIKKCEVVCAVLSQNKNTCRCGVNG